MRYQSANRSCSRTATQLIDSTMRSSLSATPPRPACSRACIQWWAAACLSASVYTVFTWSCLRGCIQWWVAACLSVCFSPHRFRVCLCVYVSMCLWVCVCICRFLSVTSAVLDRGDFSSSSAHSSILWRKTFSYLRHL